MALTDITLGQYFPGDSAVHRMDPRVKILLVIAYITVVFFATNFTAFACVAAFVVFSAMVSRIHLRFMLRSIKALWFIILLTFILNVFFNQGETVLYHWNFITISLEGIRNALFLALRLILWVTGTSLLTLTTSPISLTDAIERLLSPLKKIRFPAHELAMMMTIALRFIPTLLEETDKIQKAQMARGADFESGNLIARAKAMVPLLVPLFVSAFRRADELALAMESRCYHGGDGRTRMRILRLSVLDLYGFLTMALLYGLVLVTRFLNLL